ncbi:MAG: ABC transporter permease [Bacteroidota bacterium]
MIISYFKIAFRHLLRNRAYTLINVFGLTLGVAVCILIFLLISSEIGYDKMHLNYDSIYRIVGVSENASGKNYNGNTPYPLKEVIRTDIPEIKEITRMHFDEENTVSIAGKDLFNEENIIFTDSSFYDILDFGGGILANVFKGNFKVDMSQPGSVFLTEASALKYFGKQDPIGQTLKLGNKLDVEVKGIIKNAPTLTHLPFNMLVSYKTLTAEYVGGFDLDQFGYIVEGFTYIRLPKNIDSKQIQKKLDALVKKYIDTDEILERSRDKLVLQPLNDIHFNMSFANDNRGTTTDQKTILLLTFIAIFIISIACINFINLATAIGIKRAGEVGIRKVLGAGRKELVGQHLGEAFIITLFSLLLALGIVERTLPYFNNFTDKKLILNFSEDPLLLIFLIILLFSVSLLSGIYPAIILSSYKPVQALKSKFTSMNKSSVMLRRGLVVFQFGIAQAMIIGAMIISRQLSYFHEKPLGFEKDAIVNIFIPEQDSLKRIQFHNQITNLSNVKVVSFSIGAPTSSNNISTTFHDPETDVNMTFGVTLKTCDHRYKDTYGLKLVTGEWFTEADDASSEYQFVVNETLTKKLGFLNPEEAIGKVIGTGINNINAEIKGVIADFHTRSLHEEIKPVILMKFPKLYFNAGIRFSGGNIRSTMKTVGNVWNSIFPGYFFEYDYMDDTIKNLYKKEERTFRISQAFAGIAIFIGCLGLLGLSAFMVNQRKKEIGVRKILGASYSSIIFLFSKEFLKLLLIAFVLAAPIAWFLMKNWLTDFAYQVAIGLDVFVFTIILVGSATLITISFQSVKAALESPVKALKAD